ncbi:hypothetical protein Salat_1754300 [Sesamum alatum]|uniref:Uncharacterized protein n=1 Tax=Sesamum alatum TaxID=300844 RepID=A0AAE1Y8H3_9LAMI|nr:hypothetical protein Salat_1754300 [Sesamum alatum]
MQVVEGSADRVIIDIHRQLDGLPSTPSKPTIYRVDSHLRNDKWNDVYDPEIVSIGPYHYGILRLQNMQQLKFRYLKRYLKRRNEQSVERYVLAVAHMEKRARKCYADSFDLDENAFVTMMLLDGFFLIELFRYSCFKHMRDADDPIFRHERVLSQLHHDILLLENQLPFFVLNQLFNMTKTEENPDDDLITLALRFFDGMLLNLSVSRVLTRLPVKIIDHLCGLMHDVWCLPFAEAISRKSNERDKWENVNSISGLREAGIKFKRAKVDDNLMDIKFINGVLRIPQLIIYDETESQLMNLIAYEQYMSDGKRRYVSDYTFFMHCLINTSNDVELLRSRGIIENCLGDDEEVCLMFNRLGRNILTSSNFCYSQVFCSVNRHCQRRGKRWKANLRRNYFNSPWSIISFLAAVALLVLTLTQTTYTVLTYYNRKR